MARELSSKQKSALDRTIRKPELQPLLFENAKGLVWFDYFKEKGFLFPENLPRPVPVKQAGSVSVPFWPITNYLVKVSNELTLEENRRYAQDILCFLRETTAYAQTKGYSNYRVWWAFARIIRNLPVDIITIQDLKLVKYWLEDPYNRELVAEVLGEHWLRTLLDSNDKHSLTLAKNLMELLFQIHFATKGEDLEDLPEKKVYFHLPNWNCKQISQKIAFQSGRALGAKAADIFRKRLMLIFKELNIDRWSALRFPAIEEHEQNRKSESVESILLQSLRDSLLGFIDHSPAESLKYIEGLLKSSLETFQRIGIFLIDKRFEVLASLIDTVLKESFFTSNLRHELWHLIHNKFTSLSTKQKSSILRIIQSISLKDKDGNIDGKSSAYYKSIWLSAIHNQSKTAGKEYKKYTDMIGGEPSHPDFASYWTCGWRGWESPITPEGLLEQTPQELQVTLEKFINSPGENESDLEGLVKSLGIAVKKDPLYLLSALPHLIFSDSAFICELLEEYSALLREQKVLPWESIFEVLLDFCEKIVQQKHFWSEANARPRIAFVANRKGVTKAIGNLIRYGLEQKQINTKGQILLSEKILRIILGKEDDETFDEDFDAVSIAINSPRGTCIEAMIELTINVCLAEDSEKNGHGKSWSHFKNFYDEELSRDGFEFPTLAGMHLQNFLYCSREWTVSQLDKIFDTGNHKKWQCAMQGYAYVTEVYDEIYSYMKEKGHFLRGLDDDLVREHAGQKIMENISLAFLSGNDPLTNTNSLVNSLIERWKFQEIDELIRSIWLLRKSEKEFKAYKDIIELWALLIKCIDKASHEGRLLLSSLCKWAVFIESINTRNKELLLKAVPYADEGHNLYGLLYEIARISRKQPLESYELQKQFLESKGPEFYPTYPEEALKEIFSNLMKMGFKGKQKVSELASLYLKLGNRQPLELYQAMVKAECIE